MPTGEKGRTDESVRSDTWGRLERFMDGITFLQDQATAHRQMARRLAGQISEIETARADGVEMSPLALQALNEMRNARESLLARADAIDYGLNLPARTEDLVDDLYAMLAGQ